MKMRPFLIILAIMVILLYGCSSTDTESITSDQLQQTQTENSNDVTSLNWRIPAFNAIDHTGKPFSLKDVQGTVWLTDVIFTRCNNVCPPMTANMSKVQQELKKQGLDIKIVSFSVDPDYDKPEILTEFAKKYHADLSNWHFLTGYSYEYIQNITQTAFKSTLSKTEGPSPDVPIMISHPSRYYLIDQEGRVRKFYDGLQPDPQQIAKDIRELQAK